MLFPEKCYTTKKSQKVTLTQKFQHKEQNIRHIDSRSKKNLNAEKRSSFEKNITWAKKKA